MTHHLSKLQVEQLGVSVVPEPELAAAVAHTVECLSCDHRFVEELKRQRGTATFNFTLEPEFWFRDDHLDFDQLVGLADNTFDEETLEIINIHLNTCETCREDVRSFQAFSDATTREISVSYNSTFYESTENILWWQRLPLRPGYAVAAIVLLTVALLIGFIALSRRPAPLEAHKQDERRPSFEQSPGLLPSPAPNVVSVPSKPDDSANVVALKDTAGEVTVDKNGRVSGLDQLSDNSRRYIARAVLSEQIDRPDVLRRLSSEQSGLRGNDGGAQGFRLLYPVRSVVVEDRPVFRWESLPSASSYRVYVLDADGNQISQSEELGPTARQWRTPAPLRRGQILSWAVTAVVDGKKVISPSSSVPEMKFAVLSTVDFQELSRLKKSNSYLALGVFYAKAGLLNAAEREFQRLVELNPQSEVPRKLLQSVRNIRKAD